ncbi:hypothetical protein VQ044_19575 [Aurantimonas sp. C2-5-R2]|uniref:hypothetical protein n=2 Tax=unclassified Aurantimonas TaxID=2638230 RepID=UPI002E18D20D|nr:hypothetical protein [Aurantimonas sp. C2-3-R2]MEC5413477.1 hypothetical protein [Aurantimonas sp. C2-4-R8]
MSDAADLKPIPHEDAMPHVDHYLRTIIKLALSEIPPAIRVECASKRPRVNWQSWEDAQGKMADTIATHVLLHLDVRERDWRRHGSSTSRPMISTEV